MRGILRSARIYKYINFNYPEYNGVVEQAAKNAGVIWRGDFKSRWDPNHIELKSRRFSMKSMTIFLLFCTILLSACLSWADHGKELNYLWLAKTSGTWTENGKFGYYRGMVYRKPGESGSSDRVVVDILEKNETNQRTIKNSIELDVPSYRGYVQNISFKKINGTRMAILLDVEMNGMDGLVLREIFLISPDGSSRRIVQAKYQDIYIPLVDKEN